MASIIRLVVTARNSTAAGFRAVRNSVRRLGDDMNRGFRRMGGDASRAFGDAMRGGIGNGLAAAFKNPVLGTIVVSAAVLLASFFATAFAGAVAIGWGGLFVGMGIAFALQNKKLRAAWGKTVKDMGSKFKEASKPMEAVVEHARVKFEELGNAFAPHFANAMASAAPHVNKFMDNISSGIKSMGKTSFAPMMTAFEQLIDQFGPKFKQFMTELGNAFLVLAGAIIANKDAVAFALYAVLSIITGIINTVAMAVVTFGFLYDAITNTAGAIREAFIWSMRMANVVWHFMQVGLDVVVGWIKQAWNWSARLVGKVIHFFQTGLQSISSWLQRVWNWIKRTVGKTIHFFQSGLQGIRSWIQRVQQGVNRLVGKTIRFAQRGLQTIVSWAQRAVNWINRIKSKTIHIGASVSGWIKKLFAKGGVVGMAKGGVRGLGGSGIGAAATGGVRNNMTMVGEHGPELVDLPVGSRVKSNPDTRRMMGKSGGGGGGGIIEIKSSGSRVDDMLVEILREAVRVRGGNVQLVIGGRRIA